MADARREIIDALREAAVRASSPLSARVLGRNHKRLYNAALRTFGSLAEARAAAGLPPPERRRKWTKQRVVEELRRLARKGTRVTQDGLHESGRHALLAAALHLFGGILEARRAAGIPSPKRINTPRGTWSRGRVLSEIRKLRAAKRSLAGARVPRALRNAAQVHLGSWRRAVEAVGLRYEDVRLTTSLSDADLLEQLRALAAAQPGMTAAALNRHRLVGAWRRRFGSLAKAAALARLGHWPRPRRSRGSPAKVIEALQARRSGGKASSSAVLKREAPVLLRQIGRYFGTLAAAQRAAGLVPDAELRRERTRAGLLLALVRRALRGERMNPYAVEKDAPALFSRIYRHFGSYRAAAAIIGL